MMQTQLASIGRSILAVIDMQQRMMPAVTDHALVIDAARRMLRAATALGVPVLHTEQNPAGLGPTVPEVAELLPPDARPLVKVTCSCWSDDPFRRAVEAAGRRQVLLIGAEAHVCVQQTALELLEAGYQPFVLADAVGSRRTSDRDAALARLRAVGAVVTTVESVIFELVRRCDVPQFKQILDIVK